MLQEPEQDVGQAQLVRDTAIRAVAVSTAVLGAFLEEVHACRAWEGHAEDFAEFCAQLGLDPAAASKLRTITRVLIKECGLDASHIAAVGDQTKLYRVAAATKAALRDAQSPAAQDAVRAKTRRLIADAPILSRSDVQKSIADAGLPTRTGCQALAFICTKTGEVDPFEGCPLCTPGEAQRIIETTEDTP